MGTTLTPKREEISSAAEKMVPGSLGWASVVLAAIAIYVDEMTSENSIVEVVPERV